MVEVQGHCEGQFGNIKDIFRKNFEKNGEVGASFCVIEDGKILIDIWGGYQDKKKTIPWTRDTIVNVYSTTKVMSALCVLILVDRGMINLDTPIAEYWPEFAQNGKKNILVRNILSHTTGVPGFDEQIPLSALYDWDRMTRMIATQKPWWTPGSRSGYQSITYGYMTGHLVKLVSGKSIGKFFKDEVADPLNIDFHIGISEEHDSRIADLIGNEVPQIQEKIVSILAPTFAKVMLRPDPNDLIPESNSRKWRAAEIPSSNGHGNARSIAQIGAIFANGGQYKGKKILSSETVEKALQPQIKNRDKVNILPIEWGLGFELNNKRYGIGRHTFMWGGYGGSVCVMDREKHLSIGYAMNRLSPTFKIDKRSMNLIKGIKYIIEKY